MAPVSSSVRNEIPGAIIKINSQAYEPVFRPDHHRTLTDRLLLTTVAGAADLLADDLRSTRAGRITTVSDDGVVCDFRGKINDLQDLDTCRSIGIVLDSAATWIPDLSAVFSSLQQGILSATEDAEPVRFRVDVPTAHQREAVVAAIRDQNGWSNDPTDWQLNLVRRRDLWIAEVGSLHYSRRMDRLRRLPWSSNPVLAAILIRLAKITDDQSVHDPFCGTGTLLIAARRANASVRLSGSDHDHLAAGLARANLSDHDASADLRQADAIPFPHPDRTLDRVVSNLPFGKQVGNHSVNTALYPAVVGELARTLSRGGRAVLLTEDKRLLLDSVARTAGIKIIRERLLRYGGATPTAYVITRTRPAGRRAVRKPS